MKRQGADLKALIGVIILSVSLDVSAGIQEKITELIDQVKTYFQDKKQPLPKDIEVSLPKIPDINLKSATDLKSYDKSGSIYQQGNSYYKLPREKKRQYEMKFLNELFLVTRQSPPKAEDMSKWMNVLEGGGSREGVYRGLVLDDVYSMLESYEQNPSKKLVRFTIYFADKYLSQKFSAEKLSGFNPYLIKRILVDKCLELIEIFEKEPKNLYAWYTVFSKEMAVEYSQIWHNKIRLDRMGKNHYQWVQEVPLQHIKSEVIIKLHKVLNYLQEK